MAKLLSGQQLFMSKAIRNQYKSLDIYAPPPEIPNPGLNPCLITTTQAGNDWDIYFLKLYYLETSIGWKTATRFAPCSHLFENVPSNFQESTLTVSAHYAAFYPKLKFTQASELAKLHYAKFLHCSYMEFGGTLYASPPPEVYSLYPSNKNLRISGDSYELMGTVPEVGPFYVKFSYFYISPTTSMWVLEHSHGENTRIRWTKEALYPPWSLSCAVDSQGNHIISYQPDWLTVI